MGSRVNTADITDLVLAAMQQVNLARKPEARLSISADAPLFGDGSPLDSLGLVSLLIDVEEALQDRGFQVTLSDARAMSQTKSPFRNVTALVEYIHEHLPQTP
jgi:acyl carrier protein